MSVRTSRRLLVAAAIVGAGCGTPRPAPAARGEVTGQALFEDLCESCHATEDKDEGRPQLLGAALAPMAANRALKEVLRGAMPPGDAVLSRADATKLGDWLCATTGRAPAACLALVRNDRRFAPSASAFLSAAARASGQPHDEDAMYVAEVRDHMRKSMPSQILDISMVSIATGLAFERCLPPLPPAGDGGATPAPAAMPTDQAAFETCFGAYVDAILRPVTAPAGSAPR